MFSLHPTQRLLRFVTAIATLVMTVGTFSGHSAELGSTDTIPLKVRFWADEIELTGAVADENTAHRLRLAIHQAHPEMPVWDRLVIDAGRTVIDLPDGEELAGLLLELALSTHDGSLQVTSTELVVSGLTDSLVTHSAFEARLRPLAARYGGRHLRNRICIVHEDDLDPDFLPRRPRPTLKPRPLTHAPVELAEHAYGPPVPMLRATPLAMLNINARADIADVADALVSASNESVDAVAETAPEVIAEKPEQARPVLSLGFDPLEKIKFTPNSYLIGVEQFQLVDSATARLKALPDSAGKIILRGYPDTAGKHEYNDWLTISRLKAVQKFLVSAGIAADRLSFEAHSNPSDRDHLGSVRILVPRLPEPDPFAMPTPPATDVVSEAIPETEPTNSATSGASTEATLGSAIFSGPAPPADVTSR